MNKAGSMCREITNRLEESAQIKKTMAKNVEWLLEISCQKGRRS